MTSTQCNIAVGYQLSICSRTEQNPKKPWSLRPVATFRIHTDFTPVVWLPRTRIRTAVLTYSVDFFL